MIFALAYLIGSIPFGLLLTKIFIKQDIRKIGSGNIGATNVLRTGNKPLALATLILDSGKGGFTILALNAAFPYDPTLNSAPYALFVAEDVLIGFCAMLGHCFPIWLKFKGGKGVATTLGTLLAAVPYAGLITCLCWITTAKITKISSLSALIAVAITPIAVYLIYGSEPAIVCTLITLLVWIRHIENIKRLLKGEESRIESKKRQEKKGGPVS